MLRRRDVGENPGRSGRPCAQHSMVTSSVASERGRWPGGPNPPFASTTIRKRVADEAGSRGRTRPGQSLSRDVARFGDSRTGASGALPGYRTAAASPKRHRVKADRSRVGTPVLSLRSSEDRAARQGGRHRRGDPHGAAETSRVRRSRSPGGHCSIGGSGWQRASSQGRT